MDVSIIHAVVLMDFQLLLLADSDMLSSASSLASFRVSV